MLNNTNDEGAIALKALVFVQINVKFNLVQFGGQGKKLVENVKECEPLDCALNLKIKDLIQMRILYKRK